MNMLTQTKNTIIYQEKDGESDDGLFLLLITIIKIAVMAPLIEVFKGHLDRHYTDRNNLAIA